MTAPRTLFTVLVLALLAAYAIGSIAGSVMSSVLEPLWRSMAGPEMIIQMGAIDLGELVSSVLAAILVLVISVLLLRVFLRFAWPMAERFLKLGTPERKETSDE